MLQEFEKMFETGKQVKPSIFEKLLEYQNIYGAIAPYQFICTIIAELERTQNEKDELKKRIVRLEEDVRILKVKMEFYE